MTAVAGATGTPASGAVLMADWRTEIGSALAGSIYAVPAERRFETAETLVSAGHRVHVDLIIDAYGSHTGVEPELLARLIESIPSGLIDVHLIVGAARKPAWAEAARVLSGLAGRGIAHVTVDRSTFDAEADRIAHLRASGVPVWLELAPGETGHDIPAAADGVLVMLIPSGTIGVADPVGLDTIASLATRMPVGVDGGVTHRIARAAAEAGARLIVSGRDLFRPLIELTTTDKRGNTMTDTLPETMRTSVLEGQRALTIEDRPVPQPGPGDVLVRVAAVGVCGSDVHYFRHGRIGDFVVDAPLVLGHELSGVIVAVGDGVDAGRIGQRVAIEPQKPCHRCHECQAGRYNLCPHMEFYATPPIDGAFTGYVTIEQEFAHPVPDSMSDEAAALLEPLSVAITTMRKAHVVPGSRVLIAGAGPIGIICAQTARAFGAAEIIVSDLVPERRERALGYGATKVIDPAAVDIATAGLEVDAFIDASGAPRAVFDGIQAVRPAGYAVLVGLGNPKMELPIEHIQNKEVWVTGIFRYTDTWPAGIHLVSSGQVDLDSLVTGRFDLDHVEEALESDLDPASLKAIVYPNK
jgi:L-iditol 2-dehydrogenase